MSLCRRGSGCSPCRSAGLQPRCSILDTGSVYFWGKGHCRPLFRRVPASSCCSNLHRERSYTTAVRKLVWMENQNLRGFGCSECNWIFNPSGAPVGESLDEMKQKYEAQRDKEFAAHVCANHPRARSAKPE